MQKTILIADDDEDEIELYKDAVFYSSLPITIISACSCDEIFTATKTNGIPDMLVIDGHMPTKTVDECILAIRSDLQLKKIPLIVLSGTLKSSSLKDYYKAGINLYLTKPDSLNAIVDIFNRLYSIDWSNDYVLTAEEFYQ